MQIKTFLFLSVVVTLLHSGRIAVAETRPLWIDTDISVVPDLVSDPDDAIALELLRRSRLQIVGISTCGGNQDAETVWQSARKRITWAPLHRGGIDSCDADAVLAITRALESRELDFLVLGPATNLSKALSCRPDLREHVGKIVAIAGRQPGEEFYFPNHTFLSRMTRPMRDLNFETDPASFMAILDGRLEVELVPFSTGISTMLTFEDLAPFIDSELIDAVANWIWTLTVLGSDGLPPFDAVAAMRFITPNIFKEEFVHVRFENNQLVYFPSPGPSSIKVLRIRTDNDEYLIRTTIKRSGEASRNSLERENLEKQLRTYIDKNIENAKKGKLPDGSNMPSECLAISIEWCLSRFWFDHVYN